MNGHPGGIEHTRELLMLSGLLPGARIIDFGAGKGEAVCLMNSLGFNACGIDIAPGSGEVIRQDFLCTQYPGCSFDGVLSQCSFYISGNILKAVEEAHRILKLGGILMLSDVWFKEPAEVLSGSFEILFQKDITAQWKEYYIDSIWRGDTLPCSFEGKCRYFEQICKKI